MYKRGYMGRFFWQYRCKDEVENCTGPLKLLRDLSIDVPDTS